MALYYSPIKILTNPFQCIPALLSTPTCQGSAMSRLKTCNIFCSTAQLCSERSAGSAEVSLPHQFYRQRSLALSVQHFKVYWVSSTIYLGLKAEFHKTKAPDILQNIVPFFGTCMDALTVEDLMKILIPCRNFKSRSHPKLQHPGPESINIFFKKIGHVCAVFGPLKNITSPVFPPC